MRLKWVRDGSIVPGVGLLVAALGAECLAVFNACFADPACYPSTSALPFGELFGILAVGLILTVAGGVQVVAGSVRTQAALLSGLPFPEPDSLEGSPLAGWVRAPLSTFKARLIFHRRVATHFSAGAFTRLRHGSGIAVF